MSLNKPQGNMYKWTYTTNPIHGKCPHECSYCYVPSTRAKKFYQGSPHLVQSFFEKGLGKWKTIFVGSCFDLFADGLYPNWSNIILTHCRKYPDNTYFFQSKNTKNMYAYKSLFPSKIIIGTTVETNRSTREISKAPQPEVRLEWLERFSGIKRMLSIEPIMDFDLDIFIELIKRVNLSFISIGADSKKHHLSEPPAGKYKGVNNRIGKIY